MDIDQNRSWILFLHIAGAMRDYACSFDGGRVEKMTIAQERVLCAVFQHSPQGIKLKELANIVKLSPGAVSQIIETLVQEGIVERTNDPNDRRAVNIHVSERSKQTRDRVVKHFDEVIGGILAERTPEDRAVFVSVLGQIFNKLRPTSESVRRAVGETLLSMEEYK